jgi:ABC-2 type transport system ATP-binding protein
LSHAKPIDVRGIEKVFRSKILQRPTRALHGVDLEIEEGEVFGFLGPNGAGKTTTIRILLGLIRPTAGAGHVLGRAFGSVESRKELGFLPDSPNFYQYLTARELLDFAGKLHGIASPERARRIEETLDRVGLAGPARSRRLRTYSRGMLQRTGIAQAILHRPRLVILDEPMNGLDPIGRAELRDLLLSLKKEGVTVFLSSHVLADIETTADRVAILDRGRIVRTGSLHEILAGDGRTIELSFELAPGEALSALARRLGEFRRGPDGWIGEAKDPAEASVAVRAVMDAGGRLIEYGRKRVTLEAFFVSQVGARDGRGGQRGGGPESSDLLPRPGTKPQEART